MKKFLAVLFPLGLWAQPAPDYWQQEVHYRMQVELAPKKHQLTGSQQLWYFNHSPDSLHKLYYHLYFNAFQPGSMMDVRSQNLPDPDKRVGNRIGKLKAKEQGYQKVLGLRANGQDCFFESRETLLKVLLPQPLAPGDSLLLEMEFEAQVPLQIRRSGRDNAEGVDYTMTQWYPKIAAYDSHGWHPDPYVAREFYAPFGKFEVEITLPADYRVAATGLLQNFDDYWRQESSDGDLLRFAYQKPASKTRTWRWVANDVHDFAWAADPHYIHEAQDFDEELRLHFFYLPKYEEYWHSLPRYAIPFFRYMNEHFGRYPYPQFSAIQGGDGGMEYPMATMMKGTGKLPGLVGLLAHEGAHSWYQGVLASNEIRYPWMDEGFTSFAEDEAMNSLRKEPLENPHARAFLTHNFITQRPEEFEPLATPADYFDRNRSYSINSYSRGQLFMVQLRYITGRAAFDRALLRFFETWKFKHPNPEDFLRILERESGLELDWFYHFWVHTTKTIDYGIASVEGDKLGIRLKLDKLGAMPMPLRLEAKTRQGITYHYYIPTLSQMGAPQEESLQVLPAWPWTHPNYEVFLEGLNLQDLESLHIDRAGFMADTNRANNVYPPAKESTEED